MSIGSQIKKRRNELGWTQRELASKMEYKNHSIITMIEQDKVDVPQSRVVQFSEVLDVPIAYLMEWQNFNLQLFAEKTSPDKQELTEGEKLVLELFRKIPEEHQPAALEMLRAALKMQKKP